MTKDTRVKITVKNAWKPQDRPFDEWNIYVLYGNWVGGVERRMRDPFGMYRLTPDSYLTLQRSDDDPDIAVKVLGFNDCHFEFNNPVFGTPFMRYRPMESSSTQKFTVDEGGSIEDYFYGCRYDFDFTARRLEDTDTKNWEIQFAWVG
jgi:hypothetical protein